MTAAERVETLREQIARLVAERQTLRATAAPAEMLEQNRVEIARLQQRLSEALIETYLVPAT